MLYPVPSGSAGFETRAKPASRSCAFNIIKEPCEFRNKNFSRFRRIRKSSLLWDLLSNWINIENPKTFTVIYILPDLELKTIIEVMQY